jgi:hypothetical protein
MMVLVDQISQQAIESISIEDEHLEIMLSRPKNPPTMEIPSGMLKPHWSARRIKLGHYR